ncbi:hypothetical protein AVEN_266370-1, partial [Araneus ventricosus]
MQVVSQGRAEGIGAGGTRYATTST